MCGLSRTMIHLDITHCHTLCWHYEQLHMLNCPVSFCLRSSHHISPPITGKNLETSHNNFDFHRTFPYSKSSTIPNVSNDKVFRLDQTNSGNSPETKRCVVEPKHLMKRFWEAVPEGEKMSVSAPIIPIWRCVSLFSRCF